jgi:hypothetical protein
MRPACLVIALAILYSVARAQDPMSAPPYQRVRTGAGQWHARGGYLTHGQPAGYGFGGLYNPYVNPYFAPPLVFGSYYQRPYPYHFDYYRGRWNSPLPGMGEAMIPASACPCLGALPDAVDSPPAAGVTPPGA